MDWEAIRLAFITDPEKPDMKQFCGKRNLSYNTVSKRAAREKWANDRQAHWQSVDGKITEKVADLQATVMARNTAQKLSEIQAMKQTALKYAGGTAGKDVAYEKPHEAVAAYERLEKLERLILGESTEIIKVEDARQMVQAVIQIVREEADSDTAIRIASRLANLGAAGPGSPELHANPTA